jgi:hypothetical protein
MLFSRGVPAILEENVDRPSGRERGAIDDDRGVLEAFVDDESVLAASLQEALV